MPLRHLKHHPTELLTNTKRVIINAAAEKMNEKIRLIKINARGYGNFVQYGIAALIYYCRKLDLYPVVCAS